MQFLIATAHGARIMVVPVFMGMWMQEPGNTRTTCPPQRPARELSLFATGVHAVGYLAVTAFIAVLVVEKLGVGILRATWFNLNLIWSAALVATGALTVML